MSPITMKAVLLVAALASLSTNAFGCERMPPTVFVLGIDEQPVTTHHDLSLATLNDLSRQAGRRPVHPIPGFYSQTVAVLSARVSLEGGWSRASRPRCLAILSIVIANQGTLSATMTCPSRCYWPIRRFLNGGSRQPCSPSSPTTACPPNGRAGPG